MEQIKLALLCCYSDSELRSRLKLKQNRLIFKFLIKLFKLPSRVGEYSDYGPWIPNLIHELESQSNIELHVIVNHIGVKGGLQTFNSGGTKYYVYSSEFSSFLRKFDNLKLWMLFENNHKYVNRLLKKIKPSIVNIVGIENPSNAIPALYIKNIPVFVLSQTIYSNPNRQQCGSPKKLNWDLEIMLHKQLEYFAVYSDTHYYLLRDHNPKAIIFDFDFPTQKLPSVSSTQKEFDFVNFALSMDLRKGAHDSIYAIAKLKKKYPDITLNLVGRFPQRAELENLVNMLGVGSNVVFTDFFEKQEDLFQHLQKSRFAVLPCKLDITSQTMLQSMYYGLPLIVYKTSGTPSFNLGKQCALIADHGNIDSLAHNMDILLSSPKLAEELRQNGKWYFEQILKKNKFLINQLTDDYRSIYSNYYMDVPIPEELLFHIPEALHQQTNTIIR